MQNDELNVMNHAEVNEELAKHALPPFTKASYDVALELKGTERIRQALVDLNRKARGVHFFWFRLVRDCLTKAKEVEDTPVALPSDQRVHETGKSIQRWAGQCTAMDPCRKEGSDLIGPYCTGMAVSHTDDEQSESALFLCRLELQPLLINGKWVTDSDQMNNRVRLEGVVRFARSGRG